MNKLWLIPVFAATTLASSSAQSRPQRVNQIPNAPNNCGTCHVNQDSGGARNDFGLDVEDTLVGGVVDWSAIFDLDSDGDGFTNGEELLDPNGTWVIGDPSPGGTATAPGDDSDFPMEMGMDLGVPDMGSADVGVDAGTSDMGLEPPEDMGAGPVDMGSTPGGGALDAGSAPPGGDGDEGGDGCAAVGGGTGLWLLLPLFAARRRRR